jgi:drug/metabolite transporter (DMT)-like permease
MARQSSSSLKSLSLLLALALIWGSAFVLVKFALTSLPPLTLAWFRIAFASVTLYACARWQGSVFPKGDRQFWTGAAITGLTGMALPFSLIAWGLTGTSSGIAAILIATVPLWTMLLAHVFVPDEAMTGRRLMGVVLGFVGILLLFTDKTGGGSKAFSAGLILMASLSYSVMGIFIKKNTVHDTLAFSTAFTWCGLAFLTPVALVAERPWTLAPESAAMVSVAVLGAVHTGLATVLLMRLVGLAGVTYASLTNYLAPVATVILAAIFLSERLPASAGAGFLLIVLGVYLTGQMGRLSDLRGGGQEKSRS